MENINSLWPGTILKGEQSYRIESVLGAGGFGITYLAQTSVMFGNIPVNVRVAVKEHFVGDYCERQHDGATVVCVGTQKVRDMVERSLKDFLSEARRLSAVSAKHPNIVKVNEIIEANGTAYYVMEYLCGKSLWDYIRERGQLTEEETRSLILPIVDASAYLHASDMTHLDIKPQNIMLTDDNGALKPVLIDFGLSKHYTPDGSPTSTVNTLACSDGYSPIEQYSGITTFSPAADVYALGATILTCLTGRIPTVSTNWPLGEPYRTIDALPISEDLKEILKKSMAPAAHGRYKDGSALLAAFDATPSGTTTPITADTEVKPKEDEETQINEEILPEIEEEQTLGNDAVGKLRKALPVLLIFLLASLMLLGGYLVYDNYKAGREEALRQEMARLEEARQEAAQREENDFWNEHRNPENLDLAVKRPDGNTYYINKTEWNGLSTRRWSGLHKEGLVIIKNNECFILSLNCTEPMTWNAAVRDYGLKMPTREQGYAIWVQYESVNAALHDFGENVNSLNIYWTGDALESGPSYAWYYDLSNGYITYRNKSKPCRVRFVEPMPIKPI